MEGKMEASDITWMDKKVVVVVGATGSGKSNLAVQLAVALGGEIVSMDSIQIYKGMDIASNKVTEEEMQGIPHHMLSIVDLSDNTFDVRAFCAMAKDITEDIFKRGKLPILVGGTHYYVYSLLWNAVIDRNTSQAQGTEVVTNVNTLQLSPIAGVSPNELEEATAKLKASLQAEKTQTSKEKDTYTKRETEVLFALLKQIDPVMAEKLHAQDTRKIAKSLKVFFETGLKQSGILKFDAELIYELIMIDIIIKQKENLMPSYNAQIFCLTVDQTVLDNRVDTRVDKMMERGLLKEVKEGWEHLVKAGVDVNDHTLGILQAIGLKEFAPICQTSSAGSSALPTVDECVQQMKLHTRQYSRQQMKWIRKLVDGDGSSIQLPIMYLDASDIPTWHKTVYEPALAVVQSFLSSSAAIHQPPPPSTLLEWKKFTCDVCGGKSLNGTNEWKQHLKSSARILCISHQQKLIL